MDAIILGAGAAGLFCAREAARSGRKIAVVDRAVQPGRKLLMSGGGRCNFTNLNSDSRFYLSANPSFCISALARFTPADFLHVLDQQSIPYREESRGQMFCSRGAAAIRDMLIGDCRAAGVDFVLGNEIEQVRRNGDGFRVVAGQNALDAERLVVATGGLAAPASGASGFGLDLARTFGINLIETAPALAGLRFDDDDGARWRDLSGVSLPDVEVRCGPASLRGSLLFTHTGLSGPVILDASLYYRAGETLHVDLSPDADPLPALKALRQSRGSATARAILSRRLPRRFQDAFASACLPSGSLARFSDSELNGIAGAVKAWPIKPRGTEGYEQAEVMRGGVDTRKLSSQSMEALEVPGLFFVGEVVDVTGRLGGFNLQWAWSSGAAAARCI